MTDIVKVAIERAIAEFMAEASDEERALPAVQFLANRGDLLAGAILAALSRTDAGGEIGEIASLAQQVLSIPWLRYSPDDGHSIVGSDLPDRLATLILQSPDSRGDVALREAATFLLNRLEQLEFVDMDALSRDFYGHVDPAMGRLRAALSDDRRS
jgi:hypothetical protein